MRAVRKALDVIVASEAAAFACMQLVSPSQEDLVILITAVGAPEQFIISNRLQRRSEEGRLGGPTAAALILAAQVSCLCTQPLSRAAP